MAAALEDCSRTGYHDICFVLDESSSILFRDYQKAIDFVLGMIDSFEIGPDKTQIAVITFSDFVYHKFCFNQYHDKDELKAVVRSFGNDKYDGSTNTHDALVEAVATFSEECGLRSSLEGYSHLAIVLTDGYSNSGPEALVNPAKDLQSKASSFAIGIGQAYNLEELNIIASDPRYVYSIDDFD
jgi:hypothetical protein